MRVSQKRKLAVEDEGRLIGGVLIGLLTKIDKSEAQLEPESHVSHNCFFKKMNGRIKRIHAYACGKTSKCMFKSYRFVVFSPRCILDSSHKITSHAMLRCALQVQSVCIQSEKINIVELVDDT